jgi:hypothetical protein
MALILFCRLLLQQVAVVVLEETQILHLVKTERRAALAAAVDLLALEALELPTKDMLVVEASTQGPGVAAAVAVLALLEQPEQHLLEATEATELHLRSQAQVLPVQVVEVAVHLLEARAARAAQVVVAMVREQQLLQHNRLELQTRVAVVGAMAFL